MYIFVAVTDPEEYYKNGPVGRLKAKVRLEQATGERCLLVPYQEFNLKAVRDLNPRAIVMSGFGKRFQARKVKSFLGMDEVLHNADLPMLCICGSHQLVGFSFNRDLRKVSVLRDQPMRRLDAEEDWPRQPVEDPDYDKSRHFVASGFFPIRRVKDDPLFLGMPRTMYMRCSHYCEIKRLPKGFEFLASSRHCRIEAMRHKERPLYGVQFHPEAYEEPFLHGRRLLSNFGRIVERFWRNRRRLLDSPKNGRDGARPSRRRRRQPVSKDGGTASVPSAGVLQEPRRKPRSE